MSGSPAITPVLRLARVDEADTVDALMKASTRDLFPHFYNATQIASAVRYVASVDRTLIEDGTYFVLEMDGELVACGGWSRRNKLYTGSGEAAEDTRLLEPLVEPAHVRAMFTRVDWTRRGLGTRIVEAQLRALWVPGTSAQAGQPAGCHHDGLGGDGKGHRLRASCSSSYARHVRKQPKQAASSETDPTLCPGCAVKVIRD